MLQWMGGSRRKVTTSRKSTQNRQKQYFEQRKRRQQETSGLENCHDPVEKGREHHKEHRSLDILSLLNLSTIPQENKTAYTSEVNSSVVRSRFMKKPATTLHNIETLEESDDFVDKRSPSGYEGGTLSPVKNIHGDPDNHNNTKNEVGCKSDQGKTSVEPDLSIFDLLGDDGTIGNSIGSPMKEAHVAFSVEGLGRMGMETPPCSPQHTGRSFSHGFSPRLKTAQFWNSSKQNNMLGDVELELDMMTQDFDKPRADDFLNYSINMMDACGKSPANASYQSGEDCKRNKYFGGKSIFVGMDGGRDRWDGGLSFSDNDFLGEMECNLFEKNHSNPIDSDSTDFFKHGKYYMSENAFDGPYLPKKRSATRTMDEFNFESARSSFKLHDSGYDYDLMSNTERNSRAMRTSGFRDKSLQSDWYCSGADDAIDNFTLPSEESCSSSAVRGEAFNSTPLNSNPIQSMRRGRDGDSGSGMSYSVDSIYSREPSCKIGDEVNQGNRAHGKGKYARKSDSSKPKPIRHSSPPFMEKLVPFESWSPEKECNLSSLCQNPAIDRPFRGSMPWTEDPCIESAFPESSYTNKHGETVARPPSSLISQRFSVQPSNVESEGIEGDLFPITKFVGMYPDMAEAPSSHGGDSISPVLSKSVGKEENNESKFSPFGSEKVDFQEEKGTGSEEVFTDDKELLYNDKNCDSIRSEVQNVSLVENMETSHYSASAEKTQPLSVKNPDKTGSADENRYNHDDKVSVPCSKGEKDVKDVRLGGSKTGSKNCSIDSSSQVMMLESYVLQLLFVQKVLKQVSAQDFMKNT